VRVGKNFAHLAPHKPGSKTDRLVSFVDLAPTVLSLAGVKVPAHMQGSAFLGPRAGEPRQYVYCFRGRMDERYDISRAVRDKRFKYIRNYNPHRIYGQHLSYLWQMPATRSWEAAYKAGKCRGPQRYFWEKKPAEELYDTQKDPWEVNNLADVAEYADVLARMRKANREHLLRTRDSGFLPEGEMVAQSAGSSIYDLVRDEKRYPLERVLDAAELATWGEAKHLSKLTEMLADELAVVRYWGATGCVILGGKAAPAKDALAKCLEDPSPNVRIAAAEALVGLGDGEAPLKTLAGLLDHKNQWVALHAVNVLEIIGPPARSTLPQIRQAAKQGGDYVKRAAIHAVQVLGE